jgi:hypothetical protein
MKSAVCLGLLFTFLAAPKIGSAQMKNPPPRECRTALGINTSRDTFRVPIPIDDTAAARLAREIKHLLVLSPDDGRHPRSLLDSLGTVKGRDAVRRAMVAVLYGLANEEAATDVGVYYAYAGAEWSHLGSLLTGPAWPLELRYEALDATRVGLNEGIYRDKVDQAREAVGILLCDMAYLFRPFATEIMVAGPRPTWEKHYSLSMAQDLMFASIRTLLDPIMTGGRALVQRYAAWEPEPALRAIVTEIWEEE